MSNTKRDMLYCIKCRKHTNSVDMGHQITAGGRLQIVGICAVCGVKKTQFIGKNEPVPPKVYTVQSTKPRKKRVSRKRTTSTASRKRAVSRRRTKSMTKHTIAPNQHVSYTPLPRSILYDKPSIKQSSMHKNTPMSGYKKRSPTPNTNTDLFPSNYFTASYNTPRSHRVMI